MMMSLIRNFFILGLLVCPLAYFIWRWLFAKAVKNQPKPFYATWFFTLVISPLLSWGAAVLFVLFLLYSPERDFEREQWQKAPAERSEMVADIVDNKILIGKTQAEVQALLGLPNYRVGDGLWVYTLGVFSSSEEPHVLRVSFTNGKASTVTHGGTW